MQRFATATALAAFGLFVLMAGPVAAQRPPVAGGPASIQDPGNAQAAPRIIVVDMQQVHAESTAVRGVQRALDTQRLAFQRGIAEQEERLRGAEEQLALQRSQLNPEDFAQRRRLFEQQVIEGQRSVQERNRELEQTHNEALRVVQSQIMQIVAEVALERGANVVLARNQVLIFDRALDVTGEVVQRLNQRLPEVAVAAPSQ